MKKAAMLLACLYACTHLPAQIDSTTEKTMGEVVISVSKWEQKLNEVPNKIVKVNKGDILRNNPQTAADLLGQSGSVFIQKSQLGGGSPMIRGFATNRVLLVVDGVRMNNAIYRSGNLQNVISIDPLSTEAAEVIFGPGSLIYGSDAIGGVIDFHTLEPRFSQNDTLLTKGSALVRYSTANRENTGHVDLNLGWKKWSLLTSMSYSDFDDLKMGRFGGQDSYLRPEYVERIGGRDSIVRNSDPRIQRFSRYDQVNFLQKLRFRPNPYWDMLYSFTYARTGEAPRYDRLIQYRSGALRFAEWKYGPMLWNMHTLNLLNTRKTCAYDNMRMTAAYQDYEESRIDRTRNTTVSNRQVEQVNAVSLNLDAEKVLSKGTLFYGLEHVFNRVHSQGERRDINSGAQSPMMSRYPDGSSWRTTGIYASYKLNPHPRLTWTAGLRYNYNSLDAAFDTTFIRFPFREARIRDGALTGNTGLVFRPANGWQLNTHISTGYRMPNVDDIGKLFENAPGLITVPNPALSSEYAWNFEAGIVKINPRKFRFELNVFHTVLNNALVRRPGTFNGQDSILFDGIMSRVESLQNVAKATVYGVQLSTELFLKPEFSIVSHANWIGGRETDDVRNEQVHLRHAPPFFGSTTLRWQSKKATAELNVQYNGQIRNEDLAPSEQAKTEIYATDKEGRPYSPGWHTFNMKASYKLSPTWLLTAGWENMFNRRYRPYSSGIVAAGSNLVLSVRAAL